MFWTLEIRGCERDFVVVGEVKRLDFVCADNEVVGADNN